MPVERCHRHKSSIGVQLPGSKRKRLSQATSDVKTGEVGIEFVPVRETRTGAS